MPFVPQTDSESSMPTDSPRKEKSYLVQAGHVWFRLPGKSQWHAVAHQEYGVVWSQCGLRLVAIEAETRETLTPEDPPCARCAAYRK